MARFAASKQKALIPPPREKSRCRGTWMKDPFLRAVMRSSWDWLLESSQMLMAGDDSEGRVQNDVSARPR